MISIRQLAKRFGPNTIFSNINLEVHQGEVIAIIGPSGTGKSTFLRCLNRLETPDEGAIFIDGMNILEPHADICRLRQKMGMVFQSFNLFSHLMVIENLMLAPLQSRPQERQAIFDESLRLLELVGLGEKLYAYPDELSGGQKQRVAIARALAMQPEIVLFDEPTSALDPTMVSEVLAVIRKLAQEGLTMMIVTHEMQFARDVSTRVLYMDEGGVYEDGTPQQIFDAPQKIRTRQFIRRIRALELPIRSRRFDLYGLQGQIEQFGRKQQLSAQKIQRIQLLLEEMTHGLLLPRLPQGAEHIDLLLEYSELTRKIEITVKTPGAEIYQPEAEDLSLMLIQGLCAHFSWTCDTQETKMTVVLQE